ncbi:hypothetical protein ACOME3_003358 [Neoechinorhynchus agilis]
MAMRTCLFKPLDKNQLNGLALTKSRDAEGVEIADIRRCGTSENIPGIGDRILSINNIDVKSSGVLSVLRMLHSEARKGDVRLGLSSKFAGQKRNCRRSHSMKCPRTDELTQQWSRTQLDSQRQFTAQIGSKEKLNALSASGGQSNSFSAYGMKLVFDPEVGNVISGVVPNSVSCQSGIRAGDTIVQINHEIVMNYPFEKLRQIIESRPVESIKLYVASRQRLLERMYKGLPILTQYEPIAHQKNKKTKSSYVAPSVQPSHSFKSLGEPKSRQRLSSDVCIHKRELILQGNDMELQQQHNHHLMPLAIPEPSSKYEYMKFVQEPEVNPINTSHGWVEYHTISQRTRKTMLGGDLSWIKSLSMNDLTHDVFKARNIDLAVHETIQPQQLKSQNRKPILKNGLQLMSAAKPIESVSQNIEQTSVMQINDNIQHHKDHTSANDVNAPNPCSLGKHSVDDAENCDKTKKPLQHYLETNPEDAFAQRNDNEVEDSTTEPEVIYRLRPSNSDELSSDLTSVDTSGPCVVSNETLSAISPTPTTEFAIVDIPPIAAASATSGLKEQSVKKRSLEPMRTDAQTVLQNDRFTISQTENDDTRSRSNKCSEKTSNETDDAFMEKVDVENLWDAENIQRMRSEAKLIYAKISAHKNASLGLVLKSISANNGKLKVLHLVDRISPGLPAHEADMEEGDIIVSVNGQNTEEMNHSEIIDTISKNKSCLTFGIKRIFLDGDANEPIPQIIASKEGTDVDEEFQINIDLNERSPNVGIKLDTQLTIQSVDVNSPASRAGLKVGDRIVEINDEPLFLHDYRTSFGILKKAQATGHIKIKVLRSVANSSGPEQEQQPWGGPREKGLTWKHGVVQNYVISGIKDSEKIGIKLKECKQPPHVILEVDEDSASSRAGVKPYSYVIGVNGINVVNATFKNLMDIILQYKRYGELIFHVMEGRHVPDVGEKEQNAECSSVDYS